MDEERDVDTSKLYELLNCPKDATSNEIKKAYRKIAMKAHPDKEETQKNLKKSTELMKYYQTKIKGPLMTNTVWMDSKTTAAWAAEVNNKMIFSKI